MIHILLDNNNNHFPELNNTERHLSPAHRNKYVSWLKGAYLVVKKSQKGDTIVCWLDIQAMLCYWLGMFTFRKRDIIAINLLLKDKPTLFNRIARFLYRRALKSAHFRATVTSNEYGNYINRFLGIDKQYTLLRDLFPDEYCKWEKKYDGEGVFCGGNNSRDWDFMLRLAERLPEVIFRLVMPKHLYLEVQSRLPKNVIVKHSLPENEFLQEMSRCAIVCLPLTTEAPAGLIALYQATALGKTIITTDTVTTREYVTDDSGSILKNDIDKWAEKMRQILSNPDIARKKADAMHRFLLDNCSESQYTRTIKSLLKESALWQSIS